MRWIPVLLCTAACTSIVPETALRMSAFDPLTADPDGIAVTLVLPEGADILPNGARLSLQVSNPELGEDGGTWVLSRTRSDDGGTTYSIAEPDLSDVRRVQALATAWKDRDPEGTRGSLSIALDPCQRGERALTNSDVVSALVTLERDTAPMPLLRDVPLRRVLKNASADDLPRCP